MFKKFTEAENVTGSTQLKSSVQKGIRNKLLEQYPAMEPYLESILPKKEHFKLVKCSEHVEMIASAASGELYFFKTRDSPYLPVLRLLHQYPFMLKWQQVDRGAIKFILRGSNVMCPGLTSKGGHLVSSDVGEPVAIMCEGKQHALAVGMMLMSADEIRAKNEGIGVENVHYMNDGLWHLLAVK